MILFKRCVRILLVLFVLVSYSTVINVSSADYYDIRKTVNNTFNVGEVFEYSLSWQFISVGKTSLEITEIQNLNKRKVFLARFRVESNAYMDAIFKVRDTIETYIDTEGIFPWKLRKVVNEGKRSYEEETVFDQLKNKAYYREKEFTIPIYTQDILSIFYYARLFDIKERYIMHHDVHHEGYNYFTTVKFLDIEKIEVEAGKFNTIVIEISWWNKKGKKEAYRLWLSDDQKRMIVKADAKAPVGRFIMTLKKYSLD